MNANEVPVSLSVIDKERFGIQTARAPIVTLDNLPTILDFCYRSQVKLLIARCKVTDLQVCQTMERRGFLLMDTLLYYARNLHKVPIPPDLGNAHVRPIRPGDENGVKQVAAEAFRGYFGHYHADEKLDRAKCDETYLSWAACSIVSRKLADEVLVVELEGTIVGFGTLRQNNTKEFEGVLYAVSPIVQRRGICRSLLIKSMEWGLKKDHQQMLYSTQITNLAVQKVLVRLGFELNHAYYTFHKWFETSE